MKPIGLTILSLSILASAMVVHAREHLVCSALADPFYQLMLLDVSGGTVRQITASPGDKRNPAASPDGLRIAFECTGQIMVLALDRNLDPESELQISAIRDRAGDPRWVSNRELTYTVYSSVLNDHTSIWSIDLESGMRRKLIDDPHLDRQCDTRNGIRVWVSGAETFGYELKLWRSDSEGAFQITDNYVNDFDPRLSPDAAFVAWQQFDGTASKIRIRKLFTDQTKTMGFEGCANGEPAWSVNGNMIYWVSDRDGYSRIYRTPADQFKPQCITPAGMTAQDPDVMRTPS